MNVRKNALVCGVAVVIVAWTAEARGLSFPLSVEFPVLQSELARQLGSDGGAAVLWGTARGCRSLTIRDVVVGSEEGRVRITAVGHARVGFGFLGFCIAPLSWAGVLETVAQPTIGPDWQLRFGDARSRLYDQQHRPAIVAGRIWDLVKGRFEGEIEALALDLAPPVDEVKDFLRIAAASERAAPLLAALDTLRPGGAIVTEDGIQVRVSIDLLPAQSETISPEAPLQPIELAAWQVAVERWDGFLVFVVRDLGLLTPDDTVRNELLAILLRSRHELVAALASGSETGADPVRRLFLDTWEQLRVVVQKAAAQGMLRDRALRYAAFLLAGDALTALDAAAPGLGLEISADGLRRLARMLEPEYAGDPLDYSYRVDTDLRKLFGFHDPATLDPQEPDSRWWQARTAYAGTVDLPSEITHRLERWVPEYGELAEYRDAIGQLLSAVATRTASNNEIEPRFDRLYGDLVRTTAWQESCWRQFVTIDGKVTFLQSRTGDIGMMQVNRRVWRGFFDLEKLKWDIGYNAGAGAEILAQLLKRYGVREADDRLENAARATYSAYNGGPDAYRRYRAERVARTHRAIDRAFWEKFQAITSGRALDYVLCVEGWGSSRARLSTVPVASIPKCRMSARSS
jgi:Transglycosylase SLT domain